MILPAALLCNYGRGFCLIDVGTEGSAILMSNVLTLSQWREVPCLVRLSWGNACAWLATSLITMTTDLLTAVAAAMLIGMFLYIQKHRLQL